MSEFSYTPVSAWETYASKKDRKAMDAMARDYMDFLTHCKTERETVDWAQERLNEYGLTEGLGKTGGWSSLRGKALFAVRRGKRPLAEGMRLITAHGDTPRLDLKQRPLIEQVGVGQAKTHYYGGIRKYQWLARPLALHGVIARKDGSVVKVRLGEDAGDPVFVIADLLPHLAQGQMDQTLSKAFDAEKLNLIMGHEPLPGKDNKKGKADKEEGKEAPSVRDHMLSLLHEAYGITEEDLISAELQAVPAGPARFVGLDRAIIGGYGHDDRACVYTALHAFLDAQTPEYTTCLVIWDKEEIGSEGASGAQSRFFEYCVRDMLEAWEPKTSFGKLMLASRAISSDVHAPVDPDWQELHEKQNSALLGFGPSFSKFTGSRGKYGANDADAEYVGWLRQVMDSRKVPWQMAELGKVDTGGGGTVALYLAAFGMQVIDMGPAVLGMHSPVELLSVADLYATKAAYQAFYEAK